MQGRTVADIRRSLGVPDLITMGPGRSEAPKPPPDPLEEALAQRKALLGQNILRSTAEEVTTSAHADAQEAELRAKKLRLEAEEVEERIQELRRGRREREGPAEQEGLLLKILEVIQQDKRDLIQQNDEMRNQLHGTIREELKGVHERMASMASNGHGSPAPTLRSQIEEVREVYELIRSAAPAPEENLSATGRTIDDTLKLYGISEQHALRMAEINRENGRWQRQMDLEERKVEEDGRRGQAMTDVLNRAIPQFQTVAQDWARGRLGGAPAVSEGAAEAPYAAGTRTFSCSNCRVLIPFPPGYDHAACPDCGMNHRIEESPPPASPPPPPAPPQAEEPAPPPATALERAPQEATAYA